MRAILKPSLLLLPLALALQTTAGAQRPATSVRLKPSTTVSSVRAKPPVLGLATAGGAACPPTHVCPPCEGAKRSVLPDGSVETSYVDGTVKVVHAGGQTLTTYADGASVEENSAATTWRDPKGKIVATRKKTSVMIQTTLANLPNPPTPFSDLGRWLGRLNGDLEAALRAQMANDPEGIKNLKRYFATTERGSGIYQQIDSRTRMLKELSAAP